MKLLKELVEQQPKVIEGDIRVPLNTTSLIWQGAIIKGFFNCSATKIGSLAGSPIEVADEFNCSSTNIRSLKGGPKKVGGDFDFSNTFVSSFEWAPSEIGGSVFCHSTVIESFHNIHKHIKYIGGGDISPPKSLKSNMLGLLKIKGLTAVRILFYEAGRLGQASDIINKYLPLGDIHSCQEELIEAGLSEFARL